MFVLVANEPGRLLPTIRSRAQPLRVGPVPKAELRQWLIRDQAQEPDRAELLARLAGGLTGRAIEYARGPELLKGREATQRELLGLIASGTAVRFDSVRHLLDAAARVGGPAVEEMAPLDDEAARLAETPSMQRKRRWRAPTPLPLGLAMGSVST